jgi:outer membrane lipoprotein-sorting protein
MLAFSVIKIEQHRALHGSAGENPALLRELAATPHKSATKPRSSSGITTGIMIARMATASLRRGAACCARSSLAQSPAIEHPAPSPLVSNFRFRLSTNRAKLNRQIQGVEHPVTCRKQTAASCSNSQKIKKWKLAFSMPSYACVTNRSASAVSLTPPKAAVTLPHWHLWGRTNLRVSGFAWMIGMIAAAAFASGCAVSHKTVVKPGDAPAKLLTASKDELIGRYNQQAQSVTSLNATVSMKLTAGSAYSGVIEQYHEVNGFILAAKPANIRVIGQAPVVSKNVFDMVSDGSTFHIYIPSKSEFIEGPDNLERQASKPIENLRPQHLIDALLWEPVPAGAPVLFEESSEGTSRFYVLSAIRAPSGENAKNGSAAGSSWEMARKIWFDRTNLQIARVENFASGGKVVSDVHYSNWLSVASPPNASQASNTATSAESAMATLTYPHEIAISRPGDDYQLQIDVKKLTVNEPIAADRFVLKQPPGTKLIHPDEDAKELQKP